ncbi:Zinc finger CCCH domain-containing protein 59 [Zea mays]|uniref:Zinc finger CCCH domain-containing protein 59 n=1 Tax=Zea mays TaxID=4577 RepID=A0A1D6EF83_MAIZE|nr:Zinc finger CCCH domain-containing protein 59 [Zea mays]
MIGRPLRRSTAAAAIGGISMPSGSNKLYSGSVDGSVRIWDYNSGKMGGKVSCMITHGPWVLIGIPKGDFAWYKALNTKTGMKLRFQGPSSLVCSMAITNEMLFAGTGDGRIMAWRFPAKDSNTEPVLILSGHQRPVISLSILARRLYSGSLDKSIKGLRTLFGMHRVGKTPVLFCSLHNSNCVRLLDLPS